MAYTDLPLEQLREYRSGVAAPHDLQEFWDRTIALSLIHI